MQKTQQLSSGLIIRQNIKDSIRLILFDTKYEGWKYATHGGTAFIVNYKGKIYAITCKHVRQDFTWQQLIITDKKFGQKISAVRSVFYPSSPTQHATDSEITDIAIVELLNDAEFYEDTAYVVEESTTGQSREKDKLYVFGVLKDKTKIEEGIDIAPAYASLDFLDTGYFSNTEPILRTAIAKFDNPELTSVTGLSGSPVYNDTQNFLCGMVTRATINDEGLCKLNYIDISDIVMFLDAGHAGKDQLSYQKIRPVRPDRE